MSELDLHVYCITQTLARLMFATHLSFNTLCRFLMMEKQISRKLNLWSYDSTTNKKFIRNRCSDRNMIFNVNRVNTSLLYQKSCAPNNFKTDH